MEEEIANLNELARVAYQAYAKSTGGKNFQGQPMPGWDDLPPHITTAWMEATSSTVYEASKVLGRTLVGKPVEMMTNFHGRTNALLQRDRIVIGTDPINGHEHWLRKASADAIVLTDSIEERQEFATEEQARRALNRYRALGGTVPVDIRTAPAQAIEMK
jgi:hypothetical protein